MSDEFDKGADISQDLSNSDVTTKYHFAADIVNLMLQKAIELCKVDASIYNICKECDTLIEEETSKIFRKNRKIEKGIAFPTCISVNEICSNYSAIDGDVKTLKNGDLVKIDLGCHVDGFICIGGHSILIGEPTNEASRKADVIKAAWTAMEAAVRSVKIGAKNSDVTKIIEKTAKQFNCSPVAGTFSHEMKRHVIEGSRGIANKENLEEKIEEFEFKANEVYGLNICVSTGEGKLRETDMRPTVLRRAVETNYTLKTPLGRKFINEVNKRFPLLPFSIRALECQNAWRVGVAEATRNELVTPYAILSEKSPDLIASFKCTILLLPGGTKKITGVPFTQEEELISHHQVTDLELKNLLARSLTSKKKKKPSKTSKDTSNAPDESNDIDM